MATLVLPLKDGSIFLKKINSLFWKSDLLSLHRKVSDPSGFYILLFTTFVALEVICIVFLHYYVILFTTPWTGQLHWMTIYVVRMLVVLQEQFGSVICLDLKSRLANLNDRIQNWAPAKFFIKTNLISRIVSAEAEFSSLSLILKELNCRFGLFWLLDLSQLSMVLILTLANLTTIDMNTALTFLAVFALSAARLVMICFLLGDTTTQVK